MGNRFFSNELASFDERGFAGPFDLLSPEIAVRVGRRAVDEVLSVPSPVYEGQQADRAQLLITRDRHLDSPLVARLCTQGPLLARVAELIGPDVLLWRSDFFTQRRADRATEAHQDKRFSGARDIPAIERADGGMPVNITAWIAFTPVSPALGGLFLIPGSHKDGELPEVSSNSSETIFGKGRRLAKSYTDAERLDLHMRPGQFVLFDNLLVHGSHPTATEDQRIAVSVRFIPSDVVVRDTPTTGHGLNLSRFGSVLVTGTLRGSQNALHALPRGRECALEEEDAVVPWVADLLRSLPAKFGA